MKAKINTTKKLVSSFNKIRLNHVNIKKLKSINKRDAYLNKYLKVIEIEIDALREKITQLEGEKIRSLLSDKIKNKTTNENVKKEYALNRLEKKLEVFINKDNGYFIEVGANDGLTQSNTYSLELNRGWTGILVEPIFHKYLECKSNRSSLNIVINCACVSFEYCAEYIEIYYANLMSIVESRQNLILNQLEHAQKGEIFISKNNESVSKVLSYAQTLDSILRKNNAPSNIDLISIDVEGMELEVLKGIDFNSYTFEIIIIETRSIDIIKKYLNNKGYTFLCKLTIHDYAFSK